MQYFLHWQDASDWHESEFGTKDEVVKFLNEHLSADPDMKYRLIYGMDITDRVHPIEVIKTVDFEVPMIGF
jgi:hypothetical protein